MTNQNTALGNALIAHETAARALYRAEKQGKATKAQRERERAAWARYCKVCRETAALSAAMVGL